MRQHKIDNTDKFRKNSRWRTLSLFYETAKEGEEEYILYSLDLPESETGYPNLKEKFLSYNDPSGAVMACKDLGGIDHWKALMRAPWFSERYYKWVEELVLLTKANALKGILEVAADESDKNSYQARKFILTSDWAKQFSKDLEKRKVGRPSKEKIKQEAEKIAEENVVRLFEDAERIFESEQG